MENEEILNEEEIKEDVLPEEATEKPKKKKSTKKKTSKKKEEATETEAVEETAEEAVETAIEEKIEEIVEEASDTVSEEKEETVDEVTKEISDEIQEEVTEEAAEEPARETADVTTEETIQCPHCGKTIPAIAKHCPYCGKAVDEKEAAQSGKKKKTLIIAAVAVVALLAVALFAVPAIQKSNKYKNSLQLLEEGSYLEAANGFRELEGYKDSDDYVVYCGALEALSNGDFDKAISRFESVGELADAGRYVNYIKAVQMIIEDGSEESYGEAKTLFAETEGLLDSEGMIKYCDGVLAYLGEKDAEAISTLNTVLNDQAINGSYLKAANDIVRFLNAKGLFDKEDYSGLEEFKAIASDGDALVASNASDYANYIEGKQYYEQELYYSASGCFNRCGDFKDAYELAESCYQDRPSSGIVYRDTTSSSVSVTIYDTADEEDMFVKIYDSSDNLVESLYIRDGSSATAYFQGGRFRMAIATGESDYWYGPKEAFGSMGTYQRLLLNGSNEYYDFPGGNSFTLKFNVSNGNVDHKASNYGDF